MALEDVRSEPERRQERRELLKWQRRMVPFMTASIIVAAAFFAAVSVWEYSRIEARLSQVAPAPENPWNFPVAGPASFDDQFQVATARAAYALERELVARRYDQATLMLSARLWTRLMGFITGMILALVGAAFVLGKLNEDTSELSGKGNTAGQEWALSLRSSSPGIILAVLGCVLMTLSIAVQGSVSTQDQAIYFQRSPAAALMPAPGEASSPAAPPFGLAPPQKKVSP